MGLKVRRTGILLVELCFEIRVSDHQRDESGVTEAGSKEGLHVLVWTRAQRPAIQGSFKLTSDVNCKSPYPVQRSDVAFLRFACTESVLLSRVGKHLLAKSHGNRV